MKEYPLTYECEICHAINSAAHFHCQYCGTVPSRYSVTGRAIRFDPDGDNINSVMPVVVAYGAQRADHIRQIKHRLVTVRHDYYGTLADSRDEK